MDLKEYSPLSLAYLGDAVFELFTRVKVLNEHNTTVNELHNFSKSYVSAVAQARMYDSLMEVVTAEEADILRRGRNAKSASAAKSASISQYRHATGVEALFGYLFLKGEMDRIRELFDICTKDGSVNNEQ